MSLLLGKLFYYYTGATQGEKKTLVTNGYAYPFISEDVLNQTLPYLTELSIFSYGFTVEGDLLFPQLDDTFMINVAYANGVSPVLTLAPKTSDNQQGSVYGGKDYAITRIPVYKISLGIPNYGYDWALPYERGVTRADTITQREDIEIAIENGAEIQFDPIAMSPYFNYIQDGIEHVVWFEDVRSMEAKYNLVQKYKGNTHDNKIDTAAYADAAHGYQLKNTYGTFTGSSDHCQYV